MARSRLSSLVRHAEPKQRKARCYPISKSMPAREFVTSDVTIQIGAGRITGRTFVEVVNFIQTAFPWES
jgi:hypothetical protein